MPQNLSPVQPSSNSEQSSTWIEGELLSCSSAVVELASRHKLNLRDNVPAGDAHHLVREIVYFQVCQVTLWAPLSWLCCRAGHSTTRAMPCNQGELFAVGPLPQGLGIWQLEQELCPGNACKLAVEHYGSVNCGSGCCVLELDDPTGMCSAVRAVGQRQSCERRPTDWHSAAGKPVVGRVSLAAYWNSGPPVGSAGAGVTS